VNATLLVDSRCTLGEGIVWCPRRQAWLWTDIEGSRLWMHSVATNITRSWTLPERLGSFALCASGRLLLALAKRIAFADPDAAAGDALPVTEIVTLEPGLHTRTNDGRTDRAGHFVFGTMSELPGHTPIGSFYQFSQAHGLRRLDLGSVGIPNSICFSPDGRTIYFCDSMDKRIMRAKYDAGAAAVSAIEVFADLRAWRGSPDGSVIDEDGFLWNAAWGASLVRSFTPEGTLDREVPVPVKNPTCVAFGGAKLEDVAISSARQELSDDDLRQCPQAGGIFRIDAGGVRGLTDGEFSDG
jgi:sugar lactone lactonase YvrE